MDVEERVEYYGKTDMVYGYMFNKSVNIMKTFDKEKKYSINDILELYNVLKHLKDYVDEPRLSAEFKEVVNHDNIRSLNAVIGKFFSTIKDDNFSDTISHVDFRYRDCIWELIEKYNVYQRVSSTSFNNVLNSGHIVIERILINKKLVAKFDNEIRDFLLKNVHQSVSVLIGLYFNKKRKEIYLPASLTLEDKEQIFKTYTECQDANMGMLETIANLPVNKECLLSDTTRAKAIEAHKKLVEDFFKNKQGVYLSTNIQVSFSKTLSETQAYDFDYSSSDLKITISDEWLKNNLDYPTLLNNFIHILGLVDGEFRIRNISKPATFGLFERIFSNTDLINNYQTDGSFQLLNKFAIIEVAAYCEYIRSQFSIRLEDVLQWFFDTYLKDEFGISNFMIAMPSAGSTYLEKCRTICSEMESMIKQYNFFVATGNIDHDVIEVSSVPVEYSNIGSLIKNKYIYLNREKCSKVLYLLFSDQALLTYLPDRKDSEHYDCFFDLLSKSSLNISEYKENKIDSLNFLRDEGIINISPDGDITFANVCESLLLYDIYTNESASKIFYDKHKFKSALESLEKRGWILYDNHLLSTPESDYFNYYLNRSIFTNGYDLRNKYTHGTQRKRGEDEELHKMNYYTLLMLFVILVIKINEELCEKTESQESNTEKGNPN